MRHTVVMLLAGALLATAPLRQEQAEWELVVLGVAQDAGAPQLGCQQDLCVERRNGKRPRERVSSLGLRRTEHRAPSTEHPAPSTEHPAPRTEHPAPRTEHPAPSTQHYLFDATPDLPAQLHTLSDGRVPDGIFLTHGHIGHYTGLMYLGRESINASKVPVYGTARMQSFLASNGPWSQLVALGNIAPVTLTPDQPVMLAEGVRVTPLLVPHRDEFTDTVGFVIEGPRRSALFIPDIDQWSRWDRDIRALADRVDYLFLDGTFASPDEIPGRSIEQIPHPLMPVTRELLKGTRAQLWFIHLNHTNREIDARDVVKDGARFPL